MHESNKTILCIGDVMLDRFLVGSVGRISPEAPVPVVSLAEQRCMPGGVGNVARNVAALGGLVILIALVGADTAAAELRRFIAETAGIEDHLVVSATRPTTTKSRIVAARQQIVRIDEEIALPATADETAALRAKALAALPRADAVIISDYGKGVVTPQLAADVIKAARALDIPVFVDPKNRDFSAYRGATCVTPNITEFQTAIGTSATTDADIASHAKRLIASSGIDSMLITRSERGMMLIAADGTAHSEPARAREVFDVSGAGDTAIAAFALAAATGVAPSSAMRIANTAAGLVVAKAGTATVSLSELQEALDTASLLNRHLQSQPLSLDALRAVVDRWRHQGRTIGFTNGCFDILHAGHVSLLHEARAQCDRLIVGLNADDSVRRLKGPERPVNTLVDRAAVIAALQPVDAVVAFHDDTPLKLIEAIRPDVLIKGGDYAADAIVGADLVKERGGRIHLAPFAAGRSTTRTISRIRAAS